MLASPAVTGPGTSARPLRADALRNHRAIVAAAREAFEAEGPEVSLEEVARRAGVGPSTLYRRFAGRDELVVAVVVEYFEETVEPVLAQAAADDDAGHGVALAVEGIARAMVRHRGILRAAKDAGAFTAELALRFVGPLHDLVTRAKAAGRLRGDAEARDLASAAVMVVATAAPFDELHPDRWDRYLALVLQGLAPGAATADLPALRPPPRAEVAERLAGGGPGTDHPPRADDVADPDAPSPEAR